MTTALPDPLVPAEVDLTDYPSILIEFRRLFRSDSWVLGNPEERVASFHLWCESWHQRPAASLPDDDRLLANLSGSGMRWKKLKTHALRGWLKCSDGRLYHPVVAEKAMEAWESKREKSRKGKAGAKARWKTGGQPVEQASLLDSPGDATGDAPGIGVGMPREEKGREVNKNDEQPPTPFTLPAWVDPEAWAGFIEMRKATKNPLSTERGKKLILGDLAELKTQGQDPNACLDQSVKRGWRGVFAVKSDQPARAGQPNAAVARFVAKGGGQP